MVIFTANNTVETMQPLKKKKKLMIIINNDN